jgi:Flp pilus assembly pilin Flp
MSLLSTWRRWAGEMPALVRSEDGQAMVEYALLISLIAVVCFGVVQVFGLGISTLYSKIDAVVR